MPVPFVFTAGLARGPARCSLSSKMSLAQKESRGGSSGKFWGSPVASRFCKINSQQHVADDEQGQREEAEQVWHGQVHQVDGGAGCGWGLLILRAQGKRSWTRRREGRCEQCSLSQQTLPCSGVLVTRGHCCNINTQGRFSALGKKSLISRLQLLLFCDLFT